MRLILCLFALLLFTAPAVAEMPAIIKDGRTWTWNEELKMYQPEGKGWSFDADRQVWVRNTAKAGCACGLTGNCTCAGNCQCAPTAKSDTYRLHAGMHWRWNGREYVPIATGWAKDTSGAWYRPQAQPVYTMPLMQPLMQPVAFRSMAANCVSGG